MGPGHLAIGLAAKPAAPRLSLWVLLVASEALDLLSFVFIALGVERTAVSHSSLSQGVVIEIPGFVPFSHGFFMALVWALLFGAIAALISRDRRSAIILALVVFSHWLLDFIVHPPDLPLFFAGSPQLGIGLWTSGPGFIVSIFLELGLLAGGFAIYFIMKKRKTLQEDAK